MFPKKTAAFLCLLILCLSLVGCPAQKEESDPPFDAPQTESIPAADGSTEVRYALSIENGAALIGDTAQTLTGGAGTTEVTAVPNVGYTFLRWSDGVTEPTRAGDRGKMGTVTTIYAILSPVYLEMPVLHITTETGDEVTSRTAYIGGTISVANCAEEYAFTDVPIEIRGRGNNSWSYEKKSYRIRLPKKGQPLGLGEEPHRAWVLIANHCDHTLLRNYTTLRFADQMDGIAYSPDCTNVEVYLNGEYRGVYLLCEAIGVNKGQVEIAEDPEAGADIGYLLQLSRIAEEPYMIASDVKYEIKNDLSADETLAREQIAFIRDYMERCFAAVERGDRAEIESLIDIESAVDTYIVEETVKNLDVGWGSFYFYKDAGGKLFFGPVWDFDLAWGNANEGCETFSDLYVAEELKPQSNPWFYTLMKHGWFRDLVKERFTSEEVQDILSSLPTLVRETAVENRASFARNFEKWQIFGQKMNRETPPIIALESHDEHVDYLISWMNRRIAWMNGFLTSEQYDAGENVSVP